MTALAERVEPRSPGGKTGHGGLHSAGDNAVSQGHSDEPCSPRILRPLESSAVRWIEVTIVVGGSLPVINRATLAGKEDSKKHRRTAPRSLRESDQTV